MHSYTSFGIWISIQSVLHEFVQSTNASLPVAVVFQCKRWNKRRVVVLSVKTVIQEEETCRTAVNDDDFVMMRQNCPPSSAERGRQAMAFWNIPFQCDAQKVVMVYLSQFRHELFLLVGRIHCPIIFDNKKEEESEW